MSPTELLGTAVALIAVYLLLSLIATAFSEVLVSRLGVRGQVLLEAIEKIVGPAAAQALYQSPVIKPLHDGEARTPRAARLRRGMFGRSWARSEMQLHQLPSYIPASTFADAVLQLALGPGWRLKARSRAALKHLLDSRSAPIDPMLRQEIGHWIEELSDCANGLPQRLAARFEQVNERAVGWFRRRVARALLIIGFVIAAATNADTVQMLSRLSVDEQARAHALSLAEQLMRDAQPVVCARVDAARDPYAARHCLSHVARLKPAPADAAGRSCADAFSADDALRASAQECLAAAPTTLRVQLPPRTSACRDPELLDRPGAELQCLAGELPPILGWRGDPLLAQSWDGREAIVAGLALILFKIVGLLLSAGAISLGAPFWFDLLKKLVNVRSSVASAQAAVTGARAETAVVLSPAPADGAGVEPETAPPRAVEERRASRAAADDN